MTDAPKPLSDEELADMRAWITWYVAKDWPKTAPWVLRLLDEHAVLKAERADGAELKRLARVAISFISDRRAHDDLLAELKRHG